MASTAKTAIAKTLYGLLFVVILPVLLIEWARTTAKLVTAPVVYAPVPGGFLIAAGVILVLSGWEALWRLGGGLPMNIAPPPRLVSTHVYALLPHPIYTGFCLLCFGVALSAGSASGLWLVCPCVVLSCVALVVGFERPDLIARFGHASPVLPANSGASPSSRDRATCYWLVLIPWLILYESVSLLGTPQAPISTYLLVETRWPVQQWTEAIYASTYVWIGAAPLIAGTRKSLREFCLRGMFSMAVIFPLFFLLPFVAPPRSFVSHSLLGNLLLWERSIDTSACAFPSYHVVWAILALPVFETRWPAWRWLWRIWTAAIAVSCVTTGMHSLADVAAGVLVGLLCLRPDRVWEFLRRTSERIANSWSEWHLGPVRVINHTAYSALAAFVVLAVAGVCAGASSETILLGVAVCALVGSAAWAQIIEGSSGLLRPFGYFGGFFGAALGALIAWTLGAQFWLVVGALAVGAPWMQAIGRIRCLVQGCCHGSPTSAEIGISYTHERSRVTRVPCLRGVPIHPTPLYSILWNFYVGIALAYLWSKHVPLHFICGIYCILMGLGRFVEEAYRGEPQTPKVAGLRLYQWIALAVTLGGAVVTAIGRSAPAPEPRFTAVILLPATLFALLTGFSLGVDFPNSNRRFARLV